MVERVDPYRQMRFLLEIEGFLTAGFSRCGLPAATSDVVEYREGNELPTPRKLPGLTEYGPLVLETGVTDQSIELFEWRTLVEQGKMAAARRPVAVTLLSAAGHPAARWEFREAWPSQYEAPNLSATAADVAIERLVVVHEGFGRIPLGDDDEGDGETEGATPVLGLPTGRLPRSAFAEHELGAAAETGRKPTRTDDAADEA